MKVQQGRGLITYTVLEVNVLRGGRLWCLMAEELPGTNTSTTCIQCMHACVCMFSVQVSTFHLLKLFHTDVSGIIYKKHVVSEMYDEIVRIYIYIYCFLSPAIRRLLILAACGIYNITRLDLSASVVGFEC